MVLQDIIRRLEEFCPPAFAQDWDHVGLMAGRSDLEVNSVYIALDATTEVIEDAAARGAQLILTHHPLIFGSIRDVTDSDYVGRRVIRILESKMACYAMHTNFDIMGMAADAAEKLGLVDPDVLEVTYEDSISHEGLGRIGELPEHMSLRECAAFVKEVFRIPRVRIYGDPEEAIVRTAILPGSGKDEIDAALEAGADVLITGDITHHAGIDAVEKGIAVIDAGHYGIEKLFVPYMRDYLHRELPGLNIFCAEEKEPFMEV